MSVFQSSFSKQSVRQELEDSYESLVVPFRASLDEAKPASSSATPQYDPGSSHGHRSSDGMHSKSGKVSEDGEASDWAIPHAPDVRSKLEDPDSYRGTVHGAASSSAEAVVGLTPEVSTTVLLKYNLDSPSAGERSAVTHVLMSLRACAPPTGQNCIHYVALLAHAMLSGMPGRPSEVSPCAGGGAGGHGV